MQLSKRIIFAGIISLLVNIFGFAFGHLVWKRCVKKVEIDKRHVHDAIRFALIVAPTYTAIVYTAYIMLLTRIQGNPDTVFFTITFLEICNIIATVLLVPIFLVCQRT